MSPVEVFLRDLDENWPLQPGSAPTLRLLGSTALLLQTDYARGTKDGDVLETEEITATVRAALLALAGRDSLLHRRHLMYLEFLGPSFPFLPAEPAWRNPERISSPFQHFRLEVLDVVDVVLAKLARFHRIDRDDISAMVDRGLADADRLAARFQDAAQRWWMDSRADELPRIVRNLHHVQRDELLVPPTPVELPPWVADE